MAFSGIDTVGMAERIQLAALKKIERLDLFGIGLSGIERFEALYHPRTANRGSTDCRQIGKCWLFGG